MQGVGEEKLTGYHMIFQCISSTSSILHLQNILQALLCVVSQHSSNMETFTWVIK